MHGSKVGGADLSGLEAQAQLFYQGVNLLLLGNEAEQVAHDGLELLLRQTCLAAQVGQHVWQQVVYRAGSLQHNALLLETGL